MDGASSQPALTLVLSVWSLERALVESKAIAHSCAAAARPCCATRKSLRHRVHKQHERPLVYGRHFRVGFSNNCRAPRRAIDECHFAKGSALRYGLNDRIS